MRVAAAEGARVTISAPLCASERAMSDFGSGLTAK